LAYRTCFGWEAFITKEELFAEVPHILASTEFDKACFLRVWDVWFFPKVVGYFSVNISICYPFVNVWEVEGYFCDVVQVMFLKVFG